MKSNFAIPCPMPLTVGGENPLPPAMIETLLKRRARSLCRVASLSIRESPRATFRGLFGVYLSRESADETHRTELSVWLSTRGQPLKRLNRVESRAHAHQAPPWRRRRRGPSSDARRTDGREPHGAQ